MRLFLYEWVTGGGLADCHGALPASLAREGLAMAQALAADAARIAGCEPVLLRDRRVAALVAPGCEVIEIDSAADHRASFDAEAQRADAVLLLAPETDGALLGAARRVEAIGAPLVSPSAEFIAITSDKHRTAEALAAAGVATPHGVVLEPDEPLPERFPYPAVVKPLDGAGSQDTHVVAHAGDRPPPYAWPRRLEVYVAGTPASVALLCGEAGVTPLAPCRQRITTDGRLAYLGGSTPLPVGLAERATALALAAIAALPPARGFVGVDLVLGPAPDGREDVVIEVNPRLTTSYVGLRVACRDNLLAAMIAAARGERVAPSFDPRPLAFDADGAVYFEPHP